MCSGGGPLKLWKALVIAFCIGLLVRLLVKSLILQLIMGYYCYFIYFASKSSDLVTLIIYIVNVVVLFLLVILGITSTCIENILCLSKVSIGSFKNSVDLYDVRDVHLHRHSIRPQ